MNRRLLTSLFYVAIKPFVAKLMFSMAVGETE